MERCKEAFYLSLEAEGKVQAYVRERESEEKDKLCATFYDAPFRLTCYNSVITYAAKSVLLPI